MNVTHAAANGVDEPRQVSVRDRLRICKPYPIWQHLALPDAAIGLPLAVALAQHWKPPTTNHFDLGYLDEHGWHQVGSDGRLQLRRQERESAYRSATGEDEVRRTDQVASSRNAQSSPAPLPALYYSVVFEITDCRILAPPCLDIANNPNPALVHTTTSMLHPASTSCLQQYPILTNPHLSAHSALFVSS